MAIIERYDGNNVLRKFKVAGSVPTEAEEAKILAKLNEYAPPLPAPPVQVEKQNPGILQSVGIGAENAWLGLRHAGIEAQNQLGWDEAAVENYAQLAKDRQAQQEYEDQFQSTGDMWDKGNYGQYILHSGLQSTPQMAATLGAAGVGGLAAGPAGALAAGTLVATPMMAGSNLERQVQEQQGHVNNPGEAFAWAPVQGAADTALGVVAPGLGKIGGAVTGGLARGAAKVGLRSAEDLAAKASADAALAVAKTPAAGGFINMLKSAIGGAATELPTEVVQQAIERHQAGLDVFSDDAMKEYAQAAVAAGAMGGSFGAGHAYAEGRGAKADAKVRGQLDDDIASEQSDAAHAADQVQATRDFLAEDAPQTEQEAAAEAAYRRVMSTDFGLPAPSAANAPRIPDLRPGTRGEGFTMRGDNAFEMQANREAESARANAEQEARLQAETRALEEPLQQAASRVPETVEPTTNSTPEPPPAPAPDVTARRQVTENLLPEMPNLEAEEAPRQRYVTPEPEGRVQESLPTVEQAPQTPRTPEAPQFRIQALEKGKPVDDVAEGPGIAYVVVDSDGKRRSSPSPKRAAAETALTKRMAEVKPAEPVQQTLPGVIETPKVQTNPTPSTDVLTEGRLQVGENDATPLAQTTNAQVDPEADYTRVSQAVRDLGTMDPIRVQEASGVANPQQHFDQMVARGEAVKRADNDYRPSDQIGRERQTTALPEDASSTGYEVKAVNRDGPAPADATWVVADQKGNVMGDGYPSRKQAATAVKNEFAGRGYRTIKDPRAYAVMERALDDSGNRTAERAVSTFATRQEAEADLATRQPAAQQYSPKIQAELDRRAARRAEAEPKSPIGDTAKKVPEKPKTRAQRFEDDPSYQDARERFDATLGKLGLKNLQSEFKPFVEGPSDGVTKGRVERSADTSRATDSLLEVSHAAHLSDSEGRKVGIERTTAEEAAHMLWNDIHANDQNVLLEETRKRKVGDRDYTYDQLARRRAEGNGWSEARIREEAAASMMADSFIKLDESGDITTATPEAKGALRRVWNWLRNIGKDQRGTQYANEILKDFSEGRLGERSGGERVVPEKRASKTNADENADSDTDSVKGEGTPVDTPKMSLNELERFAWDKAGKKRIPETPIEVRARHDFVPEYAATARVLENTLGSAYANVMDRLPFVKKKGVAARKEDFSNVLANVGREWVNDKWSLGKFQDAVKKAGGYITPDTDVAYQAEMHANRISERERIAEQKLFIPLLERAANIKMSNAEFEKLRMANGKGGAADLFLQTADNPTKKNVLGLEAYLYARAAKDRNKAIYETRFTDKQREDGTANRDGSGMTDAEADAILKAVESMGPGTKKRFDNAADAAYAIVKDMKKTQLESGLISQEIHDHPGFGPNHVPLQDFLDQKNLAEETDSDVFNGSFVSERGFSIKGREGKQAAGRESLAANIIPNMISAHLRTLSRAERNSVSTALYDMVRLNANNDKMNSATRPISDFAEIVTEGDKKKSVGSDGKTKVQTDSRWKDASDIVTAKIGGREVAVRVKDPAVASELKQMILRDPQQAGYFLRGLRAYRRLLGTLATTYNGNFILNNPAKDIQTALVNSGQYKKGTGLKIAKNLLPALANTIKTSYGGKKNFDLYASPDYLELKRLGGTTSTMGLRSGEYFTDRMIREMNSLADGQPKTRAQIGKMLEAPLNLLEAASQSFEDMTRVATFKALKEQGYSPERAAQAALNITVNFSAGGTKKEIINTFYLFYNAAVQGNMALFNAAARSPKVRKSIATMAMMGAAQVFFQEFAGERDENDELLYDNLPDYVKEKTWVIPTLGLTKGGNFTLSLPAGLDSIMNLGRNAAEVALGKKDAWSASGNTLSNMGKSLYPLGAAQDFFDLNTFAPTILDAPIDLASNEDFAGRQIVPDKKGASNLEVPNSARYWNATSAPFIGLSKWLNEETGGSAIRPGAVDVSPAQMEYVYKSLTGGLGTSVMDAIRTGSMVFGSGEDNEWNPNKTLALKRFYTANDKDAKTRQYYGNRDDVMYAFEEYRAAAKNSDYDQMDRLEKKYGSELSVAPYLASLDKERSDINRAIRQMEDDDGVPKAEKEAAIRDYKKAQQELIEEGNKAISEMKREKKAAAK
jgi:hypothetical protein